MLACVVFCSKNVLGVAGESLWLIAVTSLAEVFGSVPSIYLVAFSFLELQSRDQMSLAGLLVRQPDTYVTHIHTCR